MKIAVLMSTYNGEKYLVKQISSIINQQGSFIIDLWVRDDGSSDKTKKILTWYEKKGKLKWYEGNNIGPAQSFLYLIKHCTNYDYYAFADQDDYWKPNKLLNALEKLSRNNGPQIYFSNALLVDDKLNSLGRNVYKKKPSIDFKTITCAGGILGCTMVFNKELAYYIQKKDLPEFVIMHDFYIAELCSAIGGKITYDKYPSMMYRQHSNNVIGVSKGIKKTIKERFQDIFSKPIVCIDVQAQEILNLYEKEISEDNVIWLKRISRYRSNFICRLLLACSRQTRYINNNMSLKYRLTILLGNR